MIKRFIIISIILMIIISFKSSLFSEGNIKLPLPQLKGNVSVEEVLSSRRSRRVFTDLSLTIEQVSQLLWAAQGITEEINGLRTAPSAAKIYPLEIYIVIGNEKVEDLKAGVYHYIPSQHSLQIISNGDYRSKLSEACVDKNNIGNSPVILVITVEFSRITNVFGEKGIYFACMEVGHAAENVYLQVEALGLGTSVYGGINSMLINEILDLPDEYTPLYIMPVGYY